MQRCKVVQVLQLLRVGHIKTSSLVLGSTTQPFRNSCVTSSLALRAALSSLTVWRSITEMYYKLCAGRLKSGCFPGRDGWRKDAIRLQIIFGNVGSNLTCLWTDSQDISASAASAVTVLLLTISIKRHSYLYVKYEAILLVSLASHKDFKVFNFGARNYSIWTRGWNYMETFSLPDVSIRISTNIHLSALVVAASWPEGSVVHYIQNGLIIYQIIIMLCCRRLLTMIKTIISLKNSLLR